VATKSTADVATESATVAAAEPTAAVATAALGEGGHSRQHEHERRNEKQATHSYIVSLIESGGL
jgi:microcystin-dependent protein